MISSASATTISTRGAPEQSSVRMPLRVSRTYDSGYGYVPLRFSVPLPMNRLQSERWQLRVGNEVLPHSSARTIQTWPDGSAQWVLVEMPWSAFTSLDLELELIPATTSISPTTYRCQIERDQVEPHSLRLQTTDGVTSYLARWQGHDVASIQELTTTAADESGLTYQLHGSVRADREVRWDATCRVYAAAPLVRCEFRVTNPRRARHPGGFWNLGDPGSVVFSQLFFQLTTTSTTQPRVTWIAEPGNPAQTYAASPWLLLQGGSGGEQWQSANHVQASGRVEVPMRGYRCTFDNQRLEGLRASPLASISHGQNSVAIAIPEFWEKFPSAIYATDNQCGVHIFPPECGRHELQAGERRSHVAWLWLGQLHDLGQLAWIHDPPVVHVDRSWMSACDCVPYVSSPDDDRVELSSVLADAMEGPRGFFAKREAVDEFGWRNFGDMWADHEAAYCDDPPPVLSHYNNQYDLLYNLLAQYLRDGDARWWRLADPLARHVMDIDIYHTTRDKPSYNGGLFWHTNHYHHVGLATHRCSSTTMLGKKQAAFGTGPGNEHNYSTGLLLYHHLTGSPAARECVLKLAEWVIAMDDGEQHWLGVASRARTGEASSTSQPSFHGPGRGAGNSLNSLLNGWILTRESKFVAKIEELVKRVVHPAHDFVALDLRNAERRWSYTVLLQALVRLIEHSRIEVALEPLREYCVASLVHYARWMATHERIYLATPEELEFPTETWAAQELRKGNVLWQAARYVEEPEAEQLRRKGDELLDEAWRRLMTFESRVCTRPLALVLQQGYIETALHHVINRSSDIRCPQSFEPFGQPSSFVSQKNEIRRNLRSPRGWFTIAANMLRPQAWWQSWRQSWWAEKLRG